MRDVDVDVDVYVYVDGQVWGKCMGRICRRIEDVYGGVNVNVSLWGMHMDV